MTVFSGCVFSQGWKSKWIGTQISVPVLSSRQLTVQNDIGSLHTHLRIHDMHIYEISRGICGCDWGFNAVLRHFIIYLCLYITVSQRLKNFNGNIACYHHLREQATGLQSVWFYFEEIMEHGMCNGRNILNSSNISPSNKSILITTSIRSKAETCAK